MYVYTSIYKWMLLHATPETLKTYGGFHKWGGTLKWMVYKGKSKKQMMLCGYPYFRNLHMSNHHVPQSGYHLPIVDWSKPVLSRQICDLTTSHGYITHQSWRCRYSPKWRVMPSVFSAWNAVFYRNVTMCFKDSKNAKHHGTLMMNGMSFYRLFIHLLCAIRR